MTSRARSVKTPPPSLRLVPRSRFVSPRGLITPPSDRKVQPYKPRPNNPKSSQDSLDKIPSPIIRSKSPAPVHPSFNNQQPAPISPIVRHAPIPGKEALTQYNSILTSYEQKEILSYNEIYYVGIMSKKIKPNRSQTTNYGFDLATHHYRANTGDHIAYRYEVRSILGKGAFGQVLRCTDHKTKENVALKIIINTSQMKIQGEAEIQMLHFLNEEDPNDVSHIVRVKDSFVFRNHSCVVFEVLGQNLYEFSRSNFFKRAAIGQVKTIGRQILRALQFTHGRGIVHCDMKPENVLLLLGSNTKVKVIDFGSACYIGQKHFDYIQSRFYRAPEVMLGIKYGPPMDIWSFACIIAELATGRPLFAGENECHQLQLQMQMLGKVPNHVLAISKRRDIFFDMDGKIYPVNGRRKKPGSLTIQRATGINDPQFLDLLSKCLEWDQNKRITASEALKHPFFDTQLSKDLCPDLPEPTSFAAIKRPKPVQAAASAIVSNRSNSNKNENIPKRQKASTNSIYSASQHKLPLSNAQTSQTDPVETKKNETNKNLENENQKEINNSSSPSLINKPNTLTINSSKTTNTTNPSGTTNTANTNESKGGGDGGTSSAVLKKEKVVNKKPKSVSRGSTKSLSSSRFPSKSPPSSRVMGKVNASSRIPSKSPSAAKSLTSTTSLIAASSVSSSTARTAAASSSIKGTSKQNEQQQTDSLKAVIPNPSAKSRNNSANSNKASNVLRAKVERRLNASSSKKIASNSNVHSSSFRPAQTKTSAIRTANHKGLHTNMTADTNNGSFQISTKNSGAASPRRKSPAYISPRH
ncbi:CMGC/DYRK/DYRK2 protein kinase [Tritrichomonas foetus]|uniref:dual-specificity kinase n=1 Tax=Tritrichomonas foetus TaxID=1144522 RepID=A0A1J4L1B2_9EUKA|nr:CMGC/DYRK/DYRK2 protein kinase [Tritrichomonas foetus]|eukprot:OHT15750.1 CMGC/DYRK/DYRK2 protein kinase [Tritrichomonas foetus]